MHARGLRFAIDSGHEVFFPFTARSTATVSSLVFSISKVSLVFSLMGLTLY